MPLSDLPSEQEIAALYAAQESDAAHDSDHVLRVMRLAVQIARAEGADVDVVRLAALLHDVPLPDAQGAEARDGHHRAAARFARSFLRARGLPQAYIEQVAHCIEAHRFRDSSLRPQTLEARVLYDADKLESIGAIGVARAFAYAGRHGSRLWTHSAAQVEADAQQAAPPQGPDYTPVHEYVFKLRRLYDTLHTETARRLGRERHAVLLAFFAALDAEMAGVIPP